MSDQNITLPSKPKIISEEGSKGTYEIDGLYPGYGHTLGNSLRRIILSSLTGAAITQIKVNGVNHEFSTIEGVKEDVINIILNVKKIRLKLEGNEPLKMSIKSKGIKSITAKDIEAPSQIEIINKNQPIFEVTDKNTDIDIEFTVEKGLGFVSKELVHKDRVEVGTIALDAIFTPIRRVQYETENMRVGERTDFNRLRMIIETDGTITPKEALENSIGIMISQLKAVVGFKEEFEIEAPKEEVVEEETDKEEMNDFLKTRVESLDLSSRTVNSLINANIRTVGGLTRKNEDDILELDGLGNKGLLEIKAVLKKNKISLK
ncbi:MAG: DNA-directed RNA polymerase subunit alpha [Candidatus Paceibacteria bacterium]|jgi:DNA-directed RNA polymerase subunit alpha